MINHGILWRHIFLLEMTSPFVPVALQELSCSGLGQIWVAPTSSRTSTGSSTSIISSTSNFSITSSTSTASSTSSTR